VASADFEVADNSPEQWLRAKPHQNSWLGYRISELMGMKVPAYSYVFQPAFVRRLGVSPSQQTLREEVRGLSQIVDDMLARIEKLKARR